MASILLATGAVIYFTTKEVRDHRRKKRAQKNLALGDALGEAVVVMGNDAARHSVDRLPPYQKTDQAGAFKLSETLPPYQMAGQHQHGATKTKKASGGDFKGS